MSDKSSSAFPHSGFTNSDRIFYEPEKGISLRDYFAAKALHGWLSGGAPAVQPRPTEDEIAMNMYLMADAMLKARES